MAGDTLWLCNGFPINSYTQSFNDSLIDKFTVGETASTAGTEAQFDNLDSFSSNHL